MVFQRKDITQMSRSFPVTCSTLDAKALLQAVNEQYEINTETCRLWKDGINAVYILKTEIGTLYLRVSHAARFSKKDYEEEIAVINALYAQGIPVITPIANKNKDYLWSIHAPEGIRYAVLFNEAKDAASGSHMVQMYNLGRAAAKLHKAADEQNFSVSREPITWHQLAGHPLEMLAEPLQHRKADFEFLKAAALKLWDYVKAALPQKAPYYGYCHGDMHSGNIFFIGDQPQVFDFDCMGYGYRAYDICIYAWRNTHECH